MLYNGLMANNKSLWKPRRSKLQANEKERMITDIFAFTVPSPITHFRT